MDNTTERTQKIIRDTRVSLSVKPGRPLTYREMAADLSKITPVSRATVTNWEIGLSRPSVKTLILLYSQTLDWRHDMAERLLGVLVPGFLNSCTVV